MGNVVTLPVGIDSRNAADGRRTERGGPERGLARQGRPATIAPWEKRLQIHEMMSLRVSDAVTVACGGGQLWVTRLGDSEDYVLEPGDRLHLRAGEEVAVQALRPARVSLSSVPPVAGIQDALRGPSRDGRRR